MTERGILFSAPMVRALLDGTKTQTRQVVKPQPIEVLAQPGEGKTPSWAIVNRPPATGVCVNEHGNEDWLRSPYGQPGDRLWVRETWQHSNWPAGPYDDSCDVFYRADYMDDLHGPDGEHSPEGKYRTWRPSSNMPRSASRILLEIVSVRVERLQDISAADVVAEGVEPHEVGQFMMFGLNAEERTDIRRQAAVSP